MDFCKLLDKYLNCSEPFKSRISVLEGKNSELSELLDKSENSYKIATKETEEAWNKIHDLEDELELLCSDYKKPTSVPEKKITYLRQVWYGQKIGWKAVPIQVQLFITPFDYSILQELKARKLFLKDLSKMDTHVPKVYHLFHKLFYKYGSDEKFGFQEDWRMPFELINGRKFGAAFDCEDFSHLHVSALRASGVPADRVLVSAGTTRTGFGHATIYVRDDTGVWRHLNSTSPHHKFASLTRFPSKDDSSDSIGIHPDKFWFSFNDLFAINKFSELNELEFKNSKLAKKIVIENG